MDYRRFRQRNKFRELYAALSGMGLYEVGMGIEEMQQVLAALQLSLSEQTTYRERDVEFIPPRHNRVLNSTMMSTYENVAASSSRGRSPKKVVVKAAVHHDINWNPPEEHLQRNTPENTTPESEIKSVLSEPDDKGGQDKSSSDTTSTLEEPTVIYNPPRARHNSPDIDIVQSDENYIEVSNINLRDIMEPEPEPAVSGYGFNVSPERPQTSFNSSTYENTDTSVNDNPLEGSAQSSTGAKSKIRTSISAMKKKFKQLLPSKEK